MTKSIIGLNQRQKMAAGNERFGASGAVTRLKVCADLQVLRPCERQWKPRLPQAAGTLPASGATVRRDNEIEN
jgi:hypothetical protein